MLPVAALPNGARLHFPIVVDRRRTGLDRDAFVPNTSRSGRHAADTLNVMSCVAVECVSRVRRAAAVHRCLSFQNSNCELYDAAMVLL